MEGPKERRALQYADEGGLSGVQSYSIGQYKVFFLFFRTYNMIGILVMGGERSLK